MKVHKIYQKYPIQPTFLQNCGYRIKAILLIWRKLYNVLYMPPLKTELQNRRRSDVKNKHHSRSSIFVITSVNIDSVCSMILTERWIGPYSKSIWCVFCFSMSCPAVLFMTGLFPFFVEVFIFSVNMCFT